MKINFNYNKRPIPYVEGYILKSKFYKCNYIRFKTLYSRPALGTETVELYNFNPRSEVRASVLILHGLGSRNIKFLLWMGTHLASAGVNSTIVILPGNYTRVEDKSVSGRSYLWPEIKVMYRFWEHAVVDILSSIDLLEQLNLWKKNNCVLGYCLGGMLATMASSLDDRINETIFMATGGHIPKILYKSKATRFARKLFDDGLKTPYYLHDKERLFKTYKEQFPLVKQMSLKELISNEEIHPLFKIDPISYAHLLNKSKITSINALFDETLPITSRISLSQQMSGSNKYTIPITHTGWLPFEYFLAKYILLRFDIRDLKSKKILLKKIKFEVPFIDYLFDIKSKEK